MDIRRSRIELAARVALAAALLGCVLFCLHVVTGLEPPWLDAFAERWLSAVVPILAGVALVLRSARARAERSGWILLGAALISWGLGSVYYSGVLWTADPFPFPSPCDIFYLAMYPLAYAGLARLARARSGARSQLSWLDAAVGGLAVAAVGAAAVFGRIADATGGSTLAIATNLAYPLGDLVLLALVVAMMPLAGWQLGRSWAALGLGLVLFGVADTFYLYRVAAGTYEAGGLLDAGWMVAAVIVASAGWQPAVSAARAHWRGWTAFAFPCVFGVLALGVLVYDHFQQVHLLALALAVACLVAVLGRMTLVFRENLVMLAASREDAITDSLTGLWNRRKLIADLERGGHGVLVLLDLDGFKSYNDTYGHLVGDALLDRLGHNLAAVHPGAYRMGGDEFCVLTNPDVDAAAAASAAAAALHARGEGFEITCSYGFVAFPEEAQDASAALRLADARMYAQKQSRRASAGNQSKDVLIQALEERHPVLVEHMPDVAELAVDIGRRLGLADHALEQLRNLAELHDVGKVAIPDAILLKQGPLNDEEWAFVRQHPLIGERIVGAAPALAGIARTVRSTHERWDGLGYPAGICGSQIPIEARIVAVCDSVSAMVSHRPYRDAVDLPDALEELDRCSGTQFDPDVVVAARAVLTGALAAAA